MAKTDLTILVIFFLQKHFLKNISKRNVNQKTNNNSPSNVLWTFALFPSYFQKYESGRQYFVIPTGKLLLLPLWTAHHYGVKKYANSSSSFVARSAPSSSFFFKRGGSDLITSFLPVCKGKLDIKPVQETTSYEGPPPLKTHGRFLPHTGLKESCSVVQVCLVIWSMTIT